MTEVGVPWHHEYIFIVGTDESGSKIVRLSEFSDTFARKEFEKKVDETKSSGI